MDYRKTVLGIEFGSTRIKAVLLGEDHIPVASGSFEWENSLEDGIWTYSMADAAAGLQACYADLKKNLPETPTTFGAIGISGMMHGYLPFDKNWNQLVPFRTWRNTITGEAAEKLTDLLGFAIPSAGALRIFIRQY